MASILRHKLFANLTLQFQLRKMPALSSGHFSLFKEGLLQQQQQVAFSVFTIVSINYFVKTYSIKN